MKKGKRYIKEHKIKKSKDIMIFILLIVFLCMLIYSSFKIVNYIIDSKKNNDVIKDISKSIIVDENNDNIENDIENTSKYKIDFNALKEKNSDVVGFLKVKGTDVENIVVKGSNNSYYLSHNFEKKSNSAGWIFADYRNKIDGTDKNIIIYGHNMRNNTMFGTLKKILNKEWQENTENRYIDFVTEKEESVYEVFSVYQIEAEDYYMKINFKNEEFNKYIENMKKRSIYNFDVDVQEDDSLLTLSTCANNNKYRVILHAKKIK